ncbi:glycerate kinase [Marinobacter sp. VGCF2001]|uniref:glycerate kinase family protein n=1 Tax=Marinobacter sp. VGCF2001 TaxID=3417189 RepID=UPI003CED4ECD
MRIVIAPDSFKECLPAHEVAAAIATGWRSAAPDDELVEVPLADGGEGTTVALTKALRGELHTVTVSGPAGIPVRACFGIADGGNAAIVEVAEGSGLQCTPRDTRDALHASSRGTGELILAALAHRPKTLILGLGGSATTDGGAGILQALGAQLLDHQGNPIRPGGAGLAQLALMDLRPAMKQLEGVCIVAACDVTNPLLGTQGAAAIFGPQKGADSDQVRLLNANLSHFSTLAQAQGMDMASFPGSGAAGGIGGMIKGLLGARLQPGIELVMAAVKLEEKIRDADLVITAEGAIDAQSAFGKTPAGVSRLARSCKVPVIGLCGKLGTGLGPLHDAGLTAAFSITPAPMTLTDAYTAAQYNLQHSAEQLARLVHSLSNH